MELNVEQKEQLKLAFIIALAKQYARDIGMGIQETEDLLRKIKNGAA